MSLSKQPPLPNNGTIKVYYGIPEKVIDYDLETGVAFCQLNEPDRLNALTQNQMWEYMLILKHAERDANVKCLLWTGHGRAFSSGADLSGKAPPPGLLPEAMEFFRAKGFTPGGASELGPGDMALKCLTLEFWDFSKPSVVAVNGLAVGGAANIALANYHDIVLSSTAGRFKYPFADLGLTPELGSSYMMPLITGMARAKAMMMIGDWFSAEEAKDMGLVLEVTSPEELIPRATELANTLASKDPTGLGLIKKLMNSHVRKQMDQVMDDENAAIGEAVKAMQARMRSIGQKKARL